MMLEEPTHHYLPHRTDQSHWMNANRKMATGKADSIYLMMPFKDVASNWIATVPTTNRESSSIPKPTLLDIAFKLRIIPLKTPTAGPPYLRKGLWIPFLLGTRTLPSNDRCNFTDFGLVWYITNQNFLINESRLIPVRPFAFKQCMNDTRISSNNGVIYSDLSSELSSNLKLHRNSFNTTTHRGIVDQIWRCNHEVCIDCLKIHQRNEWDASFVLFSWIWCMHRANQMNNWYWRHILNRGCAHLSQISGQLIWETHISLAAQWTKEYH
eukprot:56282_1